MLSLWRASVINSEAGKSMCDTGRPSPLRSPHSHWRAWFLRGRVGPSGRLMRQTVIALLVGQQYPGPESNRRHSG